MLILAIVPAVLIVAGAVWWALRAGLFAKLGTRMRARRSGKPRPAAPRDDAAAWTIDRVLRTLATACSTGGRPLPGVAAVVVGTDTITLRLARPDEQPPQGWSADDQGRPGPLRCGCCKAPRWTTRCPRRIRDWCPPATPIPAGCC